jgi:hypothetical protein
MAGSGRDGREGPYTGAAGFAGGGFHRGLQESPAAPRFVGAAILSTNMIRLNALWMIIEITM